MKITQTLDSLNDIYFPVEEQMVYAHQTENNYNYAPKHKAIVRPDTNEVLSIVSDKYSLVRNELVFPPLFETFKRKELKYEIKSINIFNGGASTYVDIIFPEHYIEINGDKLLLRLIAFNSYDYTKSFGLILGAIRFFCTNGMLVGSSIGRIIRKHIGIEDADISSYITMADEGLDKFDTVVKPNWLRLQAKDQNKQEGIMTIDNVANKIKFPEKRIDQVKDYWMSADKGNCPDNLWGVYNAFTYIITHKSKNNLMYQMRWSEAVDKGFQKI